MEPGEPVETGVRTKWWVWEAPEDGYYTWRLKDTGEVVPTYSKLRVTVFTGSSIEDMQLVAESGPDAVPADFVLRAVGGQRYWISAGFPAGDITAYTQRTASARVIWGPTPVNDSLSSAVPLVGLRRLDHRLEPFCDHRARREALGPRSLVSMVDLRSTRCRLVSLLDR